MTARPTVTSSDKRIADLARAYITTVNRVEAFLFSGPYDATRLHSTSCATPS